MAFTLITYYNLGGSVEERKIERIEGIELIRALENNQTIGTFVSKSTSFSIDVNDDLLEAIDVMPNNPVRKRY